MAPPRKRGIGKRLLLPQDDYALLPSHSPRERSPAPFCVGSMKPDSPLGGSSSTRRKLALNGPVVVPLTSSPSSRIPFPRPLRSTLSAPSPSSPSPTASSSSTSTPASSSSSNLGMPARTASPEDSAEALAISLSSLPFSENPFDQCEDGSDTPTPLPVSFGGFGSLFASSGSDWATASAENNTPAFNDGRPATAHGRFAGGGGLKLEETPWYQPRSPRRHRAESASPLVIDSLGGVPHWCTASASDRGRPDRAPDKAHEALSISISGSNGELCDRSMSDGESSDPPRSSKSGGSCSSASGSSSSSSVPGGEGANSSQWLFGNWLVWWPEEEKKGVVVKVVNVEENKNLLVS